MTYATIYRLARETRELAEKGARLNEDERDILAYALRSGDEKQVEGLINTLKLRAKA